MGKKKNEDDLFMEYLCRITEEDKVDKRQLELDFPIEIELSEKDEDLLYDLFNLSS